MTTRQCRPGVGAAPYWALAAAAATSAVAMAAGLWWTDTVERNLGTLAERRLPAVVDAFQNKAELVRLKARLSAIEGAENLADLKARNEAAALQEAALGSRVSAASPISELAVARRTLAEAEHQKLRQATVVSEAWIHAQRDFAEISFDLNRETQAMRGRLTDGQRSAATALVQGVETFKSVNLRSLLAKHDAAFYATQRGKALMRLLAHDGASERSAALVDLDRLEERMRASLKRAPDTVRAQVSDDLDPADIQALRDFAAEMSTARVASSARNQAGYEEDLRAIELRSARAVATLRGLAAAGEAEAAAAASRFASRAAEKLTNASDLIAPLTAKADASAALNLALGLLGQITTAPTISSLEPLRAAAAKAGDEMAALAAAFPDASWSSKLAAFTGYLNQKTGIAAARETLLKRQVDAAAAAADARAAVLAAISTLTDEARREKIATAAATVDLKNAQEQVRLATIAAATLTILAVGLAAALIAGSAPAGPVQLYFASDDDQRRPIDPERDAEARASG